MKKGFIYALKSPHTDKIYIGSTQQKFISSRFSGHKQKYNQYKEGKWDKYYTCFELFELGDVFIEKLEVYESISAEDLRRREGEIIKETENCLNKLIAGRTKKEYAKDNEEIIKQKEHEYRKNNPELMKERKKRYYDQHCEQLKQYSNEWYEKNREKRLEFYEQNKDELNRKKREKRKGEEQKAKEKEYREKNRDKINERKREWRKQKKEETV
jgi:hypothetical protein